MTNYLVNDVELTATADAIREKLGDDDPIEWESGNGFAEAIAAISGGSGGGTPAQYFADEAMPSSEDGNDGDLYIKGVTTFYRKQNGAWSTVSKDAALDSGKAYSHAERTGAHVFGVMWTRNSVPALTRLTPDSDPNHYVTVHVEGTPAPAVGNGEGYSPFDQYLPWNGMEEYNIENGIIIAKQGDAEFSRTLHDTVVFIPEFWFKQVASGTSTFYYYVSDSEISGFTKHPGSGKYFPRYLSDENYRSVSGATPLNKKTFDACHEAAQTKGANWRMLRYDTFNALRFLILVEFCNFNLQAMIGEGFTTGNAAVTTTGGTDSMSYHTGRASGTDGATQVQYRHIEDIWGNLYTWVDGIVGRTKCITYSSSSSSYTYRRMRNFYSYSIQKTGASTYTDLSDKETRYAQTEIAVKTADIAKTDAAYFPAVPNPSFYLHRPAYDSHFPWAIIPWAQTGNVGAATTHLCDYVTGIRAYTTKNTTISNYDNYTVDNPRTLTGWTYADTHRVAVGGSYNAGTKAGMFASYGLANGAANAGIGLRMEFDPAA